MVEGHQDTYKEVEQPVAAGRHGVGRSTSAERRDLGRIQPGHTQPTNGEESVEHEEEDDTGDLVGEFTLNRVDTSKDSHGSCLTSSTE